MDNLSEVSAGLPLVVCLYSAYMMVFCN